MDIRILPSNISNMIAAGEVVQRPASVVKELMENAVDAGADQVTVVITDAGRTLIQVIDNGCGMSPEEAELCFARHATSKIATAEDLSSIQTFGFRGEALASIAAVAEVTLRTRRAEDPVGCQVEFADSQHLSTIETAAPKGSNFAVRNLFYNVPARRKFLKSDNVEFKHIIEEFTRVALTRPEIGFTLTHNGRDIHVLKPAKSLKYRIQDLLGPNTVDTVVDLAAQTSVVSISGYICTPEAARKTAGTQFFFVNGRYFRSPYLHKAVMKAYEDLIAEGAVPSYFIYLTVDPHSIDVNIHPTKTEIKFEDDSVIFQVLYASVKEAIGRNSFGGGIDFSQAGAPELPVFGKEYAKYRPDPIQPDVNFDPTYNPFEMPGQAGHDGGFGQAGHDGGFGQAGHDGGFGQAGNGGAPVYNGWHYEGEKKEDYGQLFEEKTVSVKATLIWQGKYILTPAKDGILLVHVRRARERILYERFLQAITKGGHVSQSALFPVQVRVGTANRLLFDEHANLLQSLGFDISPFGNDTVVVGGVPDGFSCDAARVETLVQDLLLILSDDHTSLPGMMESSLAEKFARLGASEGKPLTSPYEAQRLIDTLFGCENAEYTPGGRKTVVLLDGDELEKKF